MLKNYKDSLFNDEIILKSQLRFKSNHHNVYTEKINKIVLSNDDDKRLQKTFDKITTYSYGANAFKVCEREMMKKICKVLVLWWNSVTTKIIIIYKW